MPGYNRAISWLLFIVFCVIYLGYFLPHSTFYHADTGWQLYSAWSVLQPGHPTDFLSSLRPGYLLNVPLVALFGTKLIVLRIVECVLSLGALTVFFTGIEPSLRKQAALPWLLMLSLLCSMQFTDFMLSYYNAPWIFLAVTLGAFGWQQYSIGLHAKTVWLVVSALALSIVAMSNVALLPGAVLVAFFLGIWVKGRRCVLFWLVFALALALLLYGYLEGLGVGAQFAAHKARGDNSLLTTFFQQAHKAYIVCLIALIGLVVSWVAQFWVRHPRGMFSKHQRFAVLTIALAIMALYSSLQVPADTMWYVAIIFGFVFLAIWLPLFYFSYRDTMTTPLQVRLLLFSVLAGLVALNHAATSQNPSAMIIYMYLPLIWVPWVWRYAVIDAKWLSKVIMLVVIVGTVLWSVLALNWTSLLTFPISQNQVWDAMGQRVTPTVASLESRMQTLYKQYGCAQKFTFAFYDQPAWYVLNHRLAPFNQSWVSRIKFYPRNQQAGVAYVLPRVQQQKHWCVLYGSAAGWYAQGGPKSKDLADVVTFLGTHSSHTIALGKGVSDNVTWLTLFVK